MTIVGSPLDEALAMAKEQLDADEVEPEDVVAELVATYEQLVAERWGVEVPPER